MAKADRFIALDISAEYIRLAVVSCGPSGEVHITNPASVLLEGDSSGMSQDAVIATALKRLLDQFPVGIRKTVLAIDGASVFSRLVQLPPVAAEKVPQTIRHEAVQNIPFPLDEVVWDAHIFNADAAEPEVLLAAAKSDYIAGLVHAASANGLSVERIVPAPAALADAVRCELQDSTGPVLLAEVAGNGINLIFVDGCRTFFRTIPALREDGAGLAQEIERSILFYSGQQAGRAPERILLSGVDAAVFGAMAARLSVPVQAFDSSCPGADGVSAVIAGLAVHRGLADRVDLNLLPQALKEQQGGRGRQTLRIVSALLILTVVGLWSGFVHIQAGRKQLERSNVLRAVAALSEIERELIPIEERTARLKQDFEVYTDAIAKRSFWLETLEEIDQVLPEGMFLQSSRPIRDNGRLTGLQISVISYLDKEAEGQDGVKSLRDGFRQRERFSERTAIASRPSKQLFARSFVLDLFFEEVP